MFNLSLTKKLALSVATFPAWQFILWFVEEVWPQTIGDPPALVANAAFVCIIGACVLVPLIRSRSYLILRILSLIAAPALAFAILGLLDRAFNFQRAIYVETSYLTAGSVGLVFSLIVAALLVVIAPLPVKRRFWMHAATSGMLFGVAFLAYFDNFLCIFGNDCVEEYEWIVLPIFLFLPVSLCLSAHFGVVDTRGNQADFDAKQLPRL